MLVVAIGVQFVMIYGIIEMLKLFVDNLVTDQMVCMMLYKYYIMNQH